MTPDEFKSVRLGLGLSQTEMAKMLGYTTRHMISRLEGGSRAITPRMALTIKLLMEKHNDTLGQRT
jgi:transcriptional regulator with XRE-family HTH domain